MKLKEVNRNKSLQECRGNLKGNFKILFPEVHARMTAARDPFAEYFKIMEEYKGNLKSVCAELKIDYPFGDADDVTGPVIIKGDDQADWDEAEGEDIEKLIQETLDGLERLQGLTDNDDVAAQILLTGLMSVGAAMDTATTSEYVMAGVEAAATLMGVEVATVGVVVGVAIVVVLCVVIPILYFTQKDAQAVLFVINKTESKYEWKRESIIHGKRVLYTDEVDGSIIFDPNDPSKNRYAGGLYSYAKCDSALIGTQAAFQLQCGDDVFNIGLSEPLNGDSSILLSSGSGQNAVESAANDVGTKKKTTTAELKTENLNITAELYPRGGTLAWVKVMVEGKP